MITPPISDTAATGRGSPMQSSCKSGHRSRTARSLGRARRVSRRHALALVAAFVLIPFRWASGAEEGAAGVAPEVPDPALQMWREVKDSGDMDLLEAFVDSFPTSPYAHAARARLQRLDEAATAVPPEPSTPKPRIRKRRQAR